ncbi:S-adenosyl-L-methionine-dependent methyltransferase [Gautieria morchelliformis]|nr:S-adenosyl-L-methionine-dependent methyltransferase [Gautieria morchelliformis]
MTKDPWSTQLYHANVPFVYSSQYTSTVLELLDAKLGDKIWDFGCGSGEVTRKLQDLVGQNGLVVGVDSSENMVEHARMSGIKHAIIADIQELHADELVETYGKCDAIFSNAVLHWCKRDPGGVLESAKKVLKPGGRFVVEFGGWTNCIGIRSALHEVLRRHSMDPVPRDPWYFPSAEDYQEEVHHISLNPRLTPLEGNVKDWMNMFCRWNFLEGLEDEEANLIMEEVNDLCAVDCCDSRGRWSMMYTRLRVVALYE